MVIILDHPKHGTKIACMEPEAVADEKNGWVRRKVAALLQPKPEPAASVTPEIPTIGNALVRTVADADELASLRMRYEAKFGAKPHHKKSAAILRAELVE